MMSHPLKVLEWITAKITSYPTFLKATYYVALPT